MPKKGEKKAAKTVKVVLPPSQAAKAMDKLDADVVISKKNNKKAELDLEKAMDASVNKACKDNSSGFARPSRPRDLKKKGPETKTVSESHRKVMGTQRARCAPAQGAGTRQRLAAHISFGLGWQTRATNWF